MPRPGREFQAGNGAFEVTDKLPPHQARRTTPLLQFANGDMVGHTGNSEATRAIEVFDECIGKVVRRCGSRRGSPDHRRSRQRRDDARSETAGAQWRTR